MQRQFAFERPTRVDGHPTYDLPYVWKDGHAFGRVSYASWVIVKLADVDPAHDVPREVGLWVPGVGADVRHKIAFTDMVAVKVEDYGPAAVVSYEDIPLHVWWELTAG